MLTRQTPKPITLPTLPRGFKYGNGIVVLPEYSPEIWTELTKWIHRKMLHRHSDPVHNNIFNIIVDYYRRGCDFINNCFIADITKFSEEVLDPLSLKYPLLGVCSSRSPELIMQRALVAMGIDSSIESKWLELANKYYTIIPWSEAMIKLLKSLHSERELLRRLVCNDLLSATIRFHAMSKELREALFGIF